MHTSLSITREKEHNRAWLKVEKGVLLSLESRQRAEEKEEHKRLEAEEETHLVKEARLKSEEEEKAH